MKEYVKNMFNTLRTAKFEYVVLFLYLLKCVLISVSYQDAIILCALACLNGFKSYNERFEIRDSLDQKYKDEMKEELKDIKTTLSVLKLGRSRTPVPGEESKRYF